MRAGAAPGADGPHMAPCLLSVARDPLEFVHHAEEIPLRAHLDPASEREAAHAFVMPDVRKHRLRGGDALAVQPCALWCALSMHDQCLMSGPSLRVGHTVIAQSERNGPNDVGSASRAVSNHALSVHLCVAQCAGAPWPQPRQWPGRNVRTQSVGMKSIDTHAPFSLDAAQM